MEPMTRGFVIHQFYQVTIDESAIDRVMQDAEEQSEEMQALNARFHRMFQSIVANDEALQKILTFQVLSKHCTESGESFDFHKVEFEWDSEGDFEFLDVLRKIAFCLQEDDLLWLKMHPGNNFEPLNLALGGYGYAKGDFTENTKATGWNFHIMHPHKDAR